MAAVKGYIEKIKYRNEDNGYTVLSISGLDDGEEYVLVGTFFLHRRGRDDRGERAYDRASIYGEQMAVEAMS